MSVNDKANARLRRKNRIRKKVKGTGERPRLSVFRSARHMYAQIIDDTAGRTLVAASSLDQDLAAGGGEKSEKKSERARRVGRLVAERAKAQGIVKVVFDRNGFLYHGRVKAVSEGAREAGLEF
jgi:large subunit ribosomal protein L18